MMWISVLHRRPLYRPSDAPRLQEGIIGDQWDRHRAAVTLSHRRNVREGVVAADVGAAGVIREVGLGGVEQVAVEEEGAAGRGLDVAHGEERFDRGDALRVGAGLAALAAVLEAAQQV